MPNQDADIEDNHSEKTFKVEEVNEEEITTSPREGTDEAKMNEGQIRSEA